MSKQQTLAVYSNSTSQSDKGNSERYKDPDWLREQYSEKGRSSYDIGIQCDVSNQTICRWLGNHGIETRESGPSIPDNAEKKLEDEDWLREQYVEKRRSGDDIADDLNVSGPPVYKALEQHGIETRFRIPEDAQEKLEDEEWLREQYVEKRRSGDDIADEINVSGDTVYKSLELHGIDTRFGISEGAKEKLEDKDWLREQYVENKRLLKGIGDEIGVSVGTVKKWLDTYGIETRSDAVTDLPEDAKEKLDDDDWLRVQYVENERSSKDIANELSVSSSSVRLRLDQYRIKTRSPNDHIPENSVEKLRNETWLREQYVGNERTILNIADGLGVSDTTVQRWFSNHGIETRGVILSDTVKSKLENEDWLREQYVENERILTDIADELDVVRRTVRIWLEKHGINIRSNIQYPDHLEHKVRSNWELQIAELLCEHDIQYEYEEIEFVMADGRIYTPDFVTEAYVIEVKGWVRDNRDRIKAQAAMELLDDREYVVVGAELPCHIHIPWEERENLIEIVSPQ